MNLCALEPMEARVKQLLGLDQVIEGLKMMTICFGGL